MCKEIEQKINSWVDENRDALIEELKQFIRIPSLTGYEGEAQKFVQAQYEKLGMDVDVFEPDIKELFEKYPEVAQFPTSHEPELELVINTPDICTYEIWQNSGYADKLNYINRPNVVGTLKGTGGGRSLILNGHVDNVTIGDLKEWKYDPFGAEEVDGKIYGRGTSDMKGGILACVNALKALQAAGVKLSGDVICESVVNEEHAGNGTLACVSKGYTADAAICADGGTWIAAETGGGVYWRIIVRGREAHTGGRWRNGQMFAISAIEKAALIVNSLVEMEKETNKDGVCLSLGVGTIEGGAYATSTARECTILGGVYFSAKMGVGEEGIIAVKNLIRNAVNRVVEKDEWLSENKPDVFFPHYDDAYVLPKENDLVPVMLDAGEAMLGRKLYVGSSSACDVRHLGNQGKIPSVMCGPGNGPVHAPNEFIVIEDYIKYIKFLALTVYKWCK